MKKAPEWRLCVVVYGHSIARICGLCKSDLRVWRRFFDHRVPHFRVASGFFSECQSGLTLSCRMRLGEIDRVVGRLRKKDKGNAETLRWQRWHGEISECDEVWAVLNLNPHPSTLKGAAPRMSSGERELIAWEEFLGRQRVGRRCRRRLGGGCRASIRRLATLLGWG